MATSYEAPVLDDDKEEHDFNAQKFEEASSLFQNCKGRIMSLICAQTQQVQSVHSLKLHPCDTLSFEGG